MKLKHIIGGLALVGAAATAAVVALKLKEQTPEDSILLDLDGDGVTDVILEDLDGDGKLDTVTAVEDTADTEAAAVEETHEAPAETPAETTAEAAEE